MLAFDDIIVVSALRGLNVEEVIRAILKRLPEGPQYYDEEIVTDQNMRQLAAEIIREKALRALNERKASRESPVQIDSYKGKSGGPLTRRSRQALYVRGTAIKESL